MQGETEMKSQEPLQDLQPKNPPVTADVISLQSKKPNRNLPILFIGITVGALCLCLIVAGSWLFLIQRGVAEVREMGPWPGSEIAPEQLVQVDLSNLGLEARQMQNAREEETWADGQYEAGVLIKYEAKGKEVVSIWALRYADRETAAEDFTSVQSFAQQTCPVNIWAQLLATGIIHCSFSDAHIKVFWSDYWIVNIMALDGTGIAPDILLDQVRDAISAHWKLIAQPAD
jgi:hypothetical protein